MSALRKAFEYYGLKGVVWLVAAPALYLLSVPGSLAASLRNCWEVPKVKWAEYNRFRPIEGLNSLTYWTQWLGLSRYGRYGVSEIFGYGTYHWRDLWNHSLPSLYLYRRLGSMSSLFAMGGWWVSHLLWIGSDSTVPWVVAVMILVLCSSGFYCNMFMRQNYNAWGWLFVPAGFYGWYTGQWAVATLAWLAVSFGSFTAMFCCGVLSLFMCLGVGSLYPALTMIPGSLKLATHLFPFVIGGGLRKSLLRTASAIGMVKKDDQMQNRPKLQVEDMCILAATGVFAAAAWIATGQAPVLVLGAMALHVVNSKVSRFADRQSMILLGITTATATVMAAGGSSWWLLIPFAYVVSPAAKIIYSSFGFGAALPVMKPFHVQPVLDGVSSFFAPVKTGQRVLMAYKDPEGEYARIFEGMKRLNEVALHVAFQQDFLLMPHWWAVAYAEHGERSIWGDTPVEVNRNMRDWGADYAVVITRGERSELGGEWRENGFETLSSLDWTDFDPLFAEGRPYAGSPPKWWLLRTSD